MLIESQHAGGRCSSTGRRCRSAPGRCSFSALFTLRVVSGGAGRGRRIASGRRVLRRLQWPACVHCGRRRRSATIAVLGGIAGFYIAGYTGVLLAVTNRPIWSDTPLLGMLFVVSAASTSAALIILLAQRSGRSRPALANLHRMDDWMIVLELLVLIAVVVSLGPVLRAWLNLWGRPARDRRGHPRIDRAAGAVVPRPAYRRREHDDFGDPGAHRRLAVAHRRGVVLGIGVAMRISLGAGACSIDRTRGMRESRSDAHARRRSWRRRRQSPGHRQNARRLAAILGNACDHSRRVGIVAACRPRAADQPAMTPTATALAGLRSRRPEWAPWLAVVEETLRDGRNRAWDAAVPTATPRTRE